MSDATAMPDRDHGGTPGWRERLAALADRTERWGSLHQTMAEAVYAPPLGKNLAADLRAALAASSPQEGGGGATREQVEAAADAGFAVGALTQALDEAGRPALAARVAARHAELRDNAAPPPAGVQVDREADGQACALCGEDGEPSTPLRWCVALNGERMLAHEACWAAPDIEAVLSPEADRDALIDLVMRATCDPGQFTPRGNDREGTPYGESANAWQRRALAAALAPLLGTPGAGGEQR